MHPEQLGHERWQERQVAQELLAEEDVGRRAERPGVVRQDQQERESRERGESGTHVRMPPVRLRSSRV